jgi:hypothetical protein
MHNLTKLDVKHLACVFHNSYMLIYRHTYIYTYTYTCMCIWEGITGARTQDLVLVRQVVYYLNCAPSLFCFKHVLNKLSYAQWAWTVILLFMLPV